MPKVTKLPHPDFSFKAQKFKGRIVEMYRDNEVYVDLCQDTLERDPARLKVAHLAAPEEFSLARAKFMELADKYRGLAEIFEAAAARMTAVCAKLV